MSDPRKEPEFLLPELEVPELELEPVRPRSSLPAKASVPAKPSMPSRSMSAAPAAASSGLPELDLEAGAGVVLGSSVATDPNMFGGATFGGDFDEDGMLDNSASLAVAADGYDRREALAAVSPAGDGAWPSGRTPAADQLEVAAHEVERVAGYGPPPKAFYAAPAYAYRVAARQRVLRKSLAQADGELCAAEAERDLRVAEMTLGLKPTLEQDERYRRLFEPLADLDRAASNRGEALSLVSSEYEAQAAKLHAELQAVNKELSQRSLSEQALSRAFVEREANWKRADAKLKRTNIEIRNLIENSRGPQGTAAAPLPADKNRELAQLNERLTVQKDEATKARAEHDRAQADLSVERQQISETQRKARRIEQHHAALAQRYQKRFDAQHKGLTEAETQRIGALAEIGRAVLESRSKLAIPREALKAIADLDRAVVEQTRKAAALLRALDAYDRDAVKQGRSIAVVLAGAALLSILLKFVL